MSLFWFICWFSFQLQYHTVQKKEMREEEKISLWGRRERGQGKHTQTEPSLTSWLRERRKVWYKASATEQRRRREGGREGRGNKCKKDRRRTKGDKKMHMSCISSCSNRTENIVLVNGSWWAQPQGVCNEKPGRLQSPVLLSTNPLSLCLPLPLPAKTEPRYDLGEGFRAFD